MDRAPFTIGQRFLRLLAHHVFGDSPVTVIRELVQNAHDALLMRAAMETPVPADLSVRIEIDEPRKEITILDAGIGMTVEDIQTSLTCLGMGKKHDEAIKQFRNVKNPEMLRNVAGLFGFGFVAATMVSKRIEIWTRARNGQAVYCQFDESEDAGVYEVRDVEGLTPTLGTRILLHVDPERARIQDDFIPNVQGGSLLHAGTVERILDKYCDLLEFEILLTSSSEGGRIVNQRTAPWERGPKPAAREMYSYFQRRFGEGLNQPLEYITFQLTPKEHGLEASGVLYVPRPSSMAEGVEGKLEIFVKRIWVCDDDLDVLPQWARFLKGVIVSPDLAVDIDRRSLDKLDKSYHQLQVTLRDFLCAYLTNLSKRNPETFRDIFDHFGDRIRHGLYAERARVEGTRPEWFKALVRVIPFRVYARQYPGGYITSINDLLGVDPTEPISRRATGEKHDLHGVNRVVYPDLQSEFRRVIADKTFPIIVPESDLDLIYLQAIGAEFDDVLQISDVEYRFATEFVEPLSGAERDRWEPFVKFVAGLLRYGDSEAAGNVTAGGISNTDLPILIHWRERTSEAEPERDKFQNVTTINTANPFMQELLRFAEDRDIRRIDETSLVGECLHSSYHLAVLEQNAKLRPEAFTDIIQRTIAVMRMSLSSAQEIERLKAARDEFQSELSKKADEIEKLSKELRPDSRIPREPQARKAAVVVVDLVGSTQALQTMDFADRGEVFLAYVEMLREELNLCGGFFDKFTGDGVVALFGVDVDTEDSGLREACVSAVQFGQRAVLLTEQFGNRCDILPRLQEICPAQSGLGLFRCRVVVSFGRVSFGYFGTAASAVGTRMVEAARICSDKDLFRNASIVVSRDVWRMIGAPDNYYCVAEDYSIRGLAYKTQLYSPGPGAV